MTRITLKDIQEFAQQRLTQGLTKPELFNAKLKEIFEFADESAMDDDAKAYVGKLMDRTLALMESGLEKRADSPDKRTMRRLLALAKGEHHRADKLAERLRGPASKLPVVEAARSVFFRALQSVLDLLFDATQGSQKGPAQFAIVTMLYWAVDELNVAFYLSERKYATQAYSHLRTVSDLLEKIELFLKKPEWAEVWAESDQRKILKELSPAAVRKKLGRPKFNVVYSFFSEMGSHGTFQAVRRRVVKRRGAEGGLKISIRLGGVPWDSEVVVSISCCIFAVGSTLVMAAGEFEDRLHGDEMLEVLKTTAGEAKEFLERYFVETAIKEGIDASELLESLKAWPVL